MHVRPGAEGGHLVARSALICHGITGASEELIKNSAGALELESWRSEPDNPQS